MRITQGLFLTAAVALAQMPLRFDVASVKLFVDDGIGKRGYSSYGQQTVALHGRLLVFIIGEAYSFPVARIQGSDAITKEALSVRQAYNIDAKSEHPVAKEELLLMLQDLLTDRFRLKLHRESKIGSVYRLTVAKTGARLEPAPDASADSNFSRTAQGFAALNFEMVRLAGFLSGNTDRVVLDETGLKGGYNFTLVMPQDVSSGSPPPKTDGLSPDSPSTAAFRDALKRLGLELIPDRGSIDYLVVDHVESPSAN